MIIGPAGATPTCQPLDTVTFGALKSHAVSLWCAQREKDPSAPITNAIAVDHLLHAWYHLETKAFSDGFLRALGWDHWSTIHHSAPSVSANNNNSNNNDNDSKAAIASLARAPSPIDVLPMSLHRMRSYDDDYNEHVNYNVFTFVGNDRQRVYPQYQLLSRASRSIKLSI